VSPYKQYEEVIGIEALDRERVRSFIAKHSEPLGKPNHFLGGWRDGEQVYLDVSVAEASLEQAQALARANHQLSIWDRKTNTEIRIAESDSGRRFALLVVPASDAEIDQFIAYLKGEDANEEPKPMPPMRESYIDMVLALDISEATPAVPLAQRQQTMGPVMLDTDPKEAALADLEALRQKRLQGFNLTDDEVRHLIRARRTLRYGNPPTEAEVEAAFARLMPGQLPGAEPVPIQRGAEVIDEEKAKQDAIAAGKMKAEVKAAVEGEAEDGEDAEVTEMSGDPVGDFATEPEADQIAESLSDRGYGAWVVPIEGGRWRVLREAKIAEHGDKDEMTPAQYAQYHPNSDYARNGVGAADHVQRHHRRLPSEGQTPYRSDDEPGDEDGSDSVVWTPGELDEWSGGDPDVARDLVWATSRRGRRYRESEPDGTLVGTYQNEADADRIAIGVTRESGSGTFVVPDGPVWAVLIEHGDKEAMSPEEYARFHPGTGVSEPDFTGGRSVFDVDTTKQPKTREEFDNLISQAEAAGKAAGNAAIPEPMHVVQRANPFDDRSAITKAYPPVMEGPAGFAWINVKPGNSAFARYLKARGLARTDSYEGGVTIWVHQYGQSMTRKEAYAHAYAEALRKAGIRAYANSRMD
jgi:hypothetical protein